MTAFDERVALVTGGGRGLGRVMAEALLSAGHQVLAMDKDERGLAQFQSQYRGAGLQIFQGDVALESDVEKAVESCLERFGRLEIVVNNAGIGVGSIRPDAEFRTPTLEELTGAVWDEFFAVNVRGPFLMTRTALPALKAARWGRIVNNTTSFFTMHRVLPYGATKAALEAASAVWAKELEGTGITVNVLVPGGPTDTPFISDEAGIPRDQMLQPGIMAAPMQWLASNGSNGWNGRRLIAANWDENIEPAQAAEAAGGPIGWPQLTADVVWPGKT